MSPGTQVNTWAQLRVHPASGMVLATALVRAGQSSGLWARNNLRFQENQCCWFQYNSAHSSTFAMSGMDQSRLSKTSRILEGMCINGSDLSLVPLSMSMTSFRMSDRMTSLIVLSWGDNVTYHASKSSRESNGT